MHHDLIKIFYDQDFQVNQIWLNGAQLEVQSVNKKFLSAIHSLASTNPGAYILWSAIDAKPALSDSEILALPQHSSELLFWYPNAEKSPLQQLGYVFFDEPFFKKNNGGSWATWLAEFNAGMVHASVINQHHHLKRLDNIKLWILILAHQGMQTGLFPHFDERLQNAGAKNNHLNTKELFQFIGLTMKKKWLIHFWMCLLWFQGKFTFAPLLLAFFSKNIEDCSIKTSMVTLKTKPLETIDVVIPTLQRKRYLARVLEDLTLQTLMPKKIIIIEQHPDKEATSELDDLLTKSYPFEIEHKFIHQLGACNARNLALSMATAKWIFFADDDIEFHSDLLKSVLLEMNKYGVKGAKISSFQPSETVVPNNTIRTSKSFGTGAGICINSKLLQFDKGFELGYGEDADFGVQIRNHFGHILQFDKHPILHHKAPSGGFRFKKTHPWQKVGERPAPAPQMMYFYLKNMTDIQTQGYFWFYLFPKTASQLLRLRKAKNAWNNSLKWAKTLA
ncbi:MAG: GT2 family glycosyltransferase [Flavobacteriales bacterium]|jgi:GT2 family glycosyltransferase